MTATTTNPVYRWENASEFQHKLQKITDDSFQVVAEVRFGHTWGWKRLDDIAWTMGFAHSADAKTACEKTLGVTTQEDQPTPKTHCNVCGWPMVEKKEDGCTAGNCSQRPVPKKQEDQPPVGNFTWVGEDHRFCIFRDGQTPGFVERTKMIGNFKWRWHCFRDSEQGYELTDTMAKKKLEEHWMKLQEREKDQPPVIVPPNGLADALDAHAAKVAEEDAEARHASAMASSYCCRCLAAVDVESMFCETCGKDHEADMKRKQAEFEARHASAMVGNGDLNVNAGVVARILSAKLGVHVTEKVLQMAMNLAGEV